MPELGAWFDLDLSKGVPRGSPPRARLPTCLPTPHATCACTAAAHTVLGSPPRAAPVATHPAVPRVACTLGGGGGVSLSAKIIKDKMYAYIEKKAVTGVTLPLFSANPCVLADEPTAKGP